MMSQLPTEDWNTPTVTLTSHAMLVPWGFFAQHIGLVETLQGVPIPQRRREYTPQTKLIEFLVSILAGCLWIRTQQSPKPGDRRAGPITAVSVAP